MDYQIFSAINSLAGKYFWLDLIGVFFAVWVIYLLSAFVLILWFDKKFRPEVNLAIVSAVISRSIIVEFIKIIVNRPRPFESIPVHLLVPDTGTGKAFSSGHAVILFAIAFSFYKTKYFWPFVVVASIASIARVYIGVHYPSDIIASVLIAWLTVWAFMGLFKKPNLR